MKKLVHISAISCLAILCFINNSYADIVSILNFDDVTIQIEQTGQDGKYLKDKSNLMLRIYHTSTSKLLTEADLTDDYYGASIYGPSKLEAMQESSGKLLIFFQARRGGDGDHTENVLHLMRYSNGKLHKITDQNIFDTKLISSDSVFSYIEGKFVLTFCSVCDGWEASSPEDIFIIPVSLSLEKERVLLRCLLSDNDKKIMIANFENQKASNIKEQLSYGNAKYTDYVSELSDTFYSIIK